MLFQARHVLTRLGSGLNFKCRPFKLLPGAGSSGHSSSFLGFVPFPKLSMEDSDYLTVGCLLF